MRSLRTLRLLPALGILIPLITVACGDDPADPAPGVPAGAGGGGAAAGKAGSPSNAGSAGSAGATAGAGGASSKGGAAGKGGAGASTGGAAGDGTKGGASGANAGAGGDPADGGEGGSSAAGNAGSSAAGTAGSSAAGASGAGGSGTAGLGGAAGGGAGGAAGGGAGGAAGGGAGGAAGDGAGGAAGDGAGGAAGDGAGGAAGNGAGGAAGDGAGGSGVAGGGGGGAPSTKKRGQVRLDQINRSVFIGTLLGSSMSGAFRPPAQPDPTRNCTTRTEGDCAVEKCELTGAAGAPAQSYLDAGNISTIGAKKPAFISFNNSKVGYSTYNGNADMLWTGGELIGVSAKGGPDIPAFSTEVKAPKDAILGALPTTTGGYRVIDMDSPYTISWNASANATVEVSIATQSTKATATVRCAFDPANSPSSIPPTLLGDLIRGSARIDIESVNHSTVTLPDVDIDVHLAFRTFDGDATVSGIGNVGPTDPAVCQAAGAKTASQCPGTPISAATCLSGNDACDYCISQKPGDCVVAATCDKFCGVVTPGSAGAKAGIGPTPTCSQSCKTEHCRQRIAAAPVPTSLAIVGDVLFFYSTTTDNSGLFQVSAAGGVPKRMWSGGFDELQVEGGALYFRNGSSLGRMPFSTTNPVSFPPPVSGVAHYDVDAAGMAFVRSSTAELGVADLDGKNPRLIAKTTGSAVDAIALDATYVYLLVDEPGQFVKIMRVLRAAPAGVGLPETVLAAIPLESVSSEVNELFVIGGAAYFLQDRTANLTRVDLDSKAITKLALPKATYNGLSQLGTNLYASSNLGVVRVDAPSFTVNGEYNVGNVTAMTMDSERVYFRGTSETAGTVQSFCQ